ncbi:hypothetical protein T492DRAFT_842911 [Pavlovales sp. CCMP2436]|nr:hypothetical protein T492DRAFT_842911 [Pavlovales sp. CCMP2436]
MSRVGCCAHLAVTDCPDAARLSRSSTTAAPAASSGSCTSGSPARTAAKAAASADWALPPSSVPSPSNACAVAAARSSEAETASLRRMARMSACLSAEGGNAASSAWPNDVCATGGTTSLPEPATTSACSLALSLACLNARLIVLSQAAELAVTTATMAAVSRG